MRKLAAIVAALALAGLVAPVHRAEAAGPESVVATLEGTIAFWDDISRVGNATNPATRIDLWAPASPGCEGVICPNDHGLLNPVEWMFTPRPGPAGCLLYDTATPSLVKFCNPFMRGEIFGSQGIPGIGDGPWCGYGNGGAGDIWLNSGGVDKFGGSGVVVSHAGPTFVYKISADGVGGLTEVGVGVMTVLDMYRINPQTGAKESGRCGLEAPDFRPANAFDIRMTLSWTDPTP